MLGVWGQGGGTEQGHRDPDCPIRTEAEDKASPPKIKESQFQACPTAGAPMGDQRGEVSRGQKVSLECPKGPLGSSSMVKPPDIFS